MGRGLAVSAVTLWTAWACSTTQPGDFETTQRDSAGIVMVETVGEPIIGHGGWQISTTPGLSIGTAFGDEAYALADVRGAHRSADGTVAIVNEGTHEVRVFDSDGAHVRSFGREGQGPGEFRSMALAGTIGADTLVIVDVGNDRFTLIHPGEGFVRQAIVGDEVVRYLYTQGVFSDGSVVFLETFDRAAMAGMPEGLNRGQAFFRSCNPDGSLGTDFGRIRGMELELEARVNAEGEPWTRTIRVPFGKEPWGAVWGDRLFLSESDRFEIQVRHQSGELLSLIRVLQEPKPVTPALHQRYVEEAVAGASSEDWGRRLRRILEAQPYPETFPAHGRMVVDRMGYLWVLESRIPGEERPARWVFDPDGHLRTRLLTPEGVEILEIGIDYILGVSEDDLDVEFVQLFALDRPSGG